VSQIIWSASHFAGLANMVVMPSDPAPAVRATRSQEVGNQAVAELLNDDLGWALGVILRRYLSAVEEIVKDVPCGPRGYQIVASASLNLANNQGVMAAHLGIDRTVFTYLVDELEAAGLVSRRPDPADRRSRRVVATEVGQALWRDRRSALAQAEADILSVLGGEKSAFKDLLQRVAVHAGQLDSSQSACQVIEELCEDEGRRDGAQRKASKRG
jgi:DNA-binding MarR family transcriptional regulator